MNALYIPKYHLMLREYDLVIYKQVKKIQYLKFLDLNNNANNFQPFHNRESFDRVKTT
jgi:hypothetical protein